MAELTIGGDGDAYLEALANKFAVEATGTNKSFLDSALDLSNTGSSQYTAYSGGYMFLRYLAKQAADGGTIIDGVIDNTFSNTSLTDSGKADNIKNSGSYVTISSDAGNDSIKNDAYNVTIDGGADNDTITSFVDNYLSIVGGTGDDLISLNSVFYSTIDDGNNNDTLSGGSGKDVIYSFENNDLLKITGTFSTSYSKSKGEVYFKVGTTSKAITLSDFTATTFHVNSSTYKISGTKLVKK